MEPYSGCTNAKLRIHLPIHGFAADRRGDSSTASVAAAGAGVAGDVGADDVDDSNGSGITVHGQTRVCKQGQALVFDDSYVHSMKYTRFSGASEACVVLVLDVWHPDLTAAATAKIVENFDPLKAPGFASAEHSQSQGHREGEEVRFKYLFTGAHGAGKTSLQARLARGTFDALQPSTLSVDFMIKRATYQGLPLKIQLWDTAGQERFRSIPRGYVRGCSAICMCFDLSDDSSLEATAHLTEQVVQNIPDFYSSPLSATATSPSSPSSSSSSSATATAVAADVAASPSASFSSSSSPPPPPPRPATPIYPPSKILLGRPLLMLLGLKSDRPRQVSRHAAIALAARHQMMYMECSSRTGENVDMVLGTMLKHTVGRLAFRKLPKADLQVVAAAAEEAAAQSSTVWQSCSIM